MTGKRVDYAQLKARFLAAVDLSPQDRRAYLEQACGNDAEMRAEVEQLLQLHDRHAAALVEPPEKAGRTEVELGEQTVTLVGAGQPATSISFPGYTLIRQVARGGQGAVYQAMQCSTKRKVAIKVLIGGPHASEAAQARFAREIELAARLAHPHIVTIFDSDVSAEGHAYFVMDYVRGMPINEYVRRRKLTLEHTLGLFATVCRAVQHAHQRGIIHRDLKPSNILVNAEGEPKILDFGLAKLLGAPSQRFTTLSQQVLGTLPYMSPEQTRGNPDEIDTRTDVYALGVILYELLTGQHPYPVDGQMADVLMHIAETPPTPLARGWKSDSGITRRARGRTRGGRCPIDGEVQTIVLKALSKERDRRYQSAGELARDIDRYLHDEPIAAKRESGWYLLRKTVRRYRTAAVIAVVFAALVTSSTIALSIIAVKLHAARVGEATQLVNSAYDRLVYSDYRSADLSALTEVLEHARRVGVDPTRIALTGALAEMGTKNVTRAIGRLEAARGDAAPNAELLYLLAWACRENGETQACRRQLEQAEQSGGPQTAAAWFFRGLALHQDEPDAAIESYRKAVQTRSHVGGLFPQAVLHLARARNQRMWCTRNLENFEESESSLKQLILMQYGLRGAYPQYLLSITHRLAAEICSEQFGVDDPRVTEHYEMALYWARAGQEVDSQSDRPITAEAECLESQGRFEEAIAARTRAIKVADSGSGKYEGLHYRWRLYYWTGEPDAALRDVERIAAVFARTQEESRFYAHVYPALLHAEMGEMEAALQRLRSLADDDGSSALDVVWAATGLRLLGRADEAQQLLKARMQAVDYGGELVQPQSEYWVRQLYAFCAGSATLEDTLAAAQRSADPSRLLGEARFHAAAMALCKGDRAQAISDLEAAHRCFDDEQRYTYHARILLQKLRLDPHWPGWIPMPCPESLNQRNGSGPRHAGS